MLYETRCDHCRKEDCTGCPEYRLPVVLTNEEIDTLLNTPSQPRYKKSLPGDAFKDNT